MITCPFITLSNLIAGRQLMPEFVFSGNCDGPVREMTEILSRWLSHPPARATVRREMLRCCELVGAPGATGRAALAILEQLGAATIRRAAA